MPEFVKRNYLAEFRADGANGLIEGVPIVLNTATDIGGYFKEVICDGALDNVDRSDVGFYWNHDLNTKRIARTCIPLDKKGGMVLDIDSSKVSMKANPNRQRTDVNDLYLSIEDGTCDGMSFMFSVAEDRWENLESNYPTRYITKIGELVEVSAVNYPAYKQTSIGVRSIESQESDREVLGKARTLLNKRSTEIEQEKRELELLKEKAKYLY